MIQRNTSILTHPTLDQMQALGLGGMTTAYRELAEQRNADDLIPTARLDGRFPVLVDKLARVHPLILDDWGTHCLTDQQHPDLPEIFEERYRRKSTLISARLQLAHCVLYLRSFHSLFSSSCRTGCNPQWVHRSAGMRPGW